MRPQIIVAALVLLSAAATACAPGGNDAGGTDASGASGSGGTGTGVPATVMLADFMLEPEDMTVEGPSVTFSVTNNGPTIHNFSIRDASGEVVLATEDLRPGESAMLTGDLEPGEYETFCSLPGHESLGMQAVLTVTAP